MTQEQKDDFSSGWIIARSFPSKSNAMKAYEALADSLLVDELDASVFHFAYENQEGIAILGEEPLSQPNKEKVMAVLDEGSETFILNEDIIDELRSARREFKQTGALYSEKKHHPSPKKI